MSLVLARPLLAADALPKLQLPIDCTLGENCWVIQYPDMDPSEDALDGAGLDRTYDGHKGVDIGLADMAAMRAGVDVIAPAAGRVLRFRDEMPDILVTDAATRAAVENRECGNGMVIDHGNGLETQLCHMRQNSVVVKPGDRVEVGDKLGQVGASGLAGFPHLHVTTRINGIVIDPVINKPILPEDADKVDLSGSLWADPVLAAYDPFDIVQIGFGTGEISLETALAGDAYLQSAPTEPPALIVWGVLYGVREGDRLTMSILDPNGDPFFDNTVTLDKTQIRYFRFGGKRVRALLAKGTYTGRIIIERGDGPNVVRESRQTTIRIDD